MRVLIVNTSDNTGGAAVAANRLKDALNNNGVKAKMLVRDKNTDDITVVALPKSPWLKWNFLWERFCIFLHLHFKKLHLWEVDTALCGSDITELPEFKEADIVHLSWINQGMLSLKSIKKILESGKPVVWTMHDLWMATGICHYTRGCSNNSTQCGNCVLLPGSGSNKDLSNKVFMRKNSLLKQGHIHFVACSKWLQGEALKSSLFVGQDITSVPNPIDAHLFHPSDKREARLRLNLPLDKKIILFVSQKVTDERKGAKYFVEAINKLTDAHPEMKQTTVIAILGGHSEDITSLLSLPSYPLGYINQAKRIVDVYNSANAFVLPSLEDNLPNTIMEAMACGVPCIGFNVGGIPEEISHKSNGYVAEYKNADDLANGIYWVLEEADYEALSHDAVRKVNQCYSQRAVAARYIEIYEKALKNKGI